MLLERILPTNSRFYGKWHPQFSAFGEKIDAQGWMQLFTIWTLIVAGTVVSMDWNDRYVYWEWDGWLIGLLKLMFVSIIFFIYLKPKKIWTAGSKRLSKKELGVNSFTATSLLLFGYYTPFYQSDLYPVFDFSYIIGFIGLLPYLLAFLSCLLVFQFTIELDKEKGVWKDIRWDNKSEYFSASVVLMVLAVLLGIYFKDPVISTAGAVATPFSAIALIWPSHVRHLQRARFYPLFIFAMFICVRAPWFLMPLVALFVLLRTVNYLRYGIVYPSFGVDFLEEE